MTDKKLNKILLQKGQTNLVSEPFYVGEKRVALSAFANGTGLPPGARITFQEVLYVDGGNSHGTICVPGKINPSNEFDYKPFVSCGCEPALTERLSYMEIDRQGWYRAVYVGPSRASVLLTVNELYVNAGTGCCSKPCCPIEVDLVVEKSVSSETIVSGDAGAFTIVLTNKGPDASRGGSLVDVLPEGFSYGTPSAVFTGGAIGTQPALAQLAAGDWHYTQIPPGGVITITIPFTATAVGSSFPRTNEAAVYPGIDEVDTNWVNNTDNVYYVIVKPTVDAWVTKTVAQENLKEGDTFTFTVTAGNSGPDAAPGTTIKDALPSGLTVTSITAAYSGGAAGPQPTVAELAAGYQVPTFPSGGQVVLTITGAVAKAGYYLNFASVTAPTSVNDASLNNNSASALINVAVKTVDLSLVKTSDKESYKIGDTVTYTIVVSNAGPDDANGGVVKDALPSTLTSQVVVSSTYTGGAGSGTPTIAQLASGWAVPTMPSGGSVTLVVTGVATVAGVLSNTASVTAPTGRTDTNFGNNTSTVITPVAPGPLQSCGEDVTLTTNLLSDQSFTVCLNGQEVPFECGMKLKAVGECCETTVLVDSQSSVSAGAGVCLSVEPTGWAYFSTQDQVNNQGRMILQLRDKAILQGTAVLDPNGNPGAVLQRTITNTYNCPMLVEADLWVLDNYRTEIFKDEALSFVHILSETLAEPFPTFPYPNVKENVSVHNINSIQGLSIDHGFGGVDVYAGETVVGGKYVKILQPGQSMTLYAQSWIVFYEAKMSFTGGFIIHANKHLRVKRTLGAIEV